jgi:HD-GYP domain-containing protein (c-di-GMP phosphodiesterase class II)
MLSPAGAMAPHLTRGGLRLSELLAALSIVIDVGMRRPPGEAVRICLLATSLGRALGLEQVALRDVFYTGLLQDLGCGPVIVDYVVADGEEPVELVDEDFFRASCEVGGIMAERLQLGGPVRDSLLQVFERWDGRGRPRGLAGEEIPAPIRVARVATHAVVLQRMVPGEAGIDAIQRRSGFSLDPHVCKALITEPSLLDHPVPETWDSLLAAEPEPHIIIGRDQVDEIARAFGDRTDMFGRGYLRGHADGVASLAAAAASAAGLDSDEQRGIRWAGSLHDLGRVAVPVDVWTKPGPLTAAEWELVRLHAYHTERILTRSAIFEPLAIIAGTHHERCDGSGYHRRARAHELPASSRILAVADALQAMTQRRPYREAMPLPVVADELADEVHSGRLDAQALDAVLTAAGAPRRDLAVSRPAGLTKREVEVLRLVAMGFANKEIAAQLGLSPKTVDNHVQNVYAKIGVSARASAGMFAMQHHLV